jgi:hypothetical protein
MRIRFPRQAALHTALLGASAGLLAACAGTALSGHPPRPAVTVTVTGTGTGTAGQSTNAGDEHVRPAGAGHEH